MASDEQGKKAKPQWKLLYGSFSGMEQLAAEEMHRVAQDYVPYGLRPRPEAADGHSPNDNAIILGTRESSPLIAQMTDKKVIDIPAQPGSYAMARIDAPWPFANRVLVVAGSDPKGLLNGVHACCARFFTTSSTTYGVTSPVGSHPQAQIPDFNISESPAAEYRGLWTWGDAVHDYRGYIDNMARLRMNMLVMWESEPAMNCADLVAYAHTRGIEVILGFHWGWGVQGLDLTDPGHRDKMRAHIVRNYLENYRHLGMDGIYFQTNTEHLDLESGGRSTASVVCDWVNHVARGLYEEEPDLYIQFGLHASSIGWNYTDLAGLDSRISIMWEDAGALPYSYIPTLDLRSEPALVQYPTEIVDYDTTLEYSKKLATFRPGTEFALVQKGYVDLPRVLDEDYVPPPPEEAPPAPEEPQDIEIGQSAWGPQGSYMVGGRSSSFIRKRAEQRREEWDCSNSRWYALYPYAARFYREMLDCRPSRISATALVHDGSFEMRIEPGVSIFAETVWNPHQDDSQILQRAMSPHYLEER